MVPSIQRRRFAAQYSLRSALSELATHASRQQPQPTIRKPDRTHYRDLDNPESRVGFDLAHGCSQRPCQLDQLTNGDEDSFASSLRRLRREQPFTFCGNNFPGQLCFGYIVRFGSAGRGITFTREVFEEFALACQDLGDPLIDAFF